MFSSPTALKQIHTNDFSRSNAYEALIFPGDSHTMLTSPSIDEHTFFRKLLSPAFGTTFLQKLCPLMSEVVLSVFSKMDAQLIIQKNDCIINIWNLCFSVAFDVIGTTAFGTPFGMVEKGEHPIVTNIGKSLPIMMMKFVTPTLVHPFLPGHKESLVYKSI